MEPERPIEKLVRAYAKRQRESAGPPPELHPATRRLLQGEVARQFRAQRAERPAWFGRRLFWAWGFAILAVLGVATALLVLPGNRRERQQWLADSRRSELARPGERAAPLAESRPTREITAHEMPAETAAAPAAPPPAKQALPLGSKESLNALSKVDSETAASLANRRMTPAASPPAARAQDKLKALAKAPGSEAPAAAPGATFGGGAGGPMPPTTSAVGGPMPSSGLAGGPALSLASRDAPPAPATSPAAVAPPINAPAGESSLASTAGVTLQDKAESNLRTASRGYQTPTTSGEFKSSISDRAAASTPTALASAAGSAQPMGNSAYRFLGEFAASNTVDKDMSEAQPTFRARLAGARQDRSSLDKSLPIQAPILINFKLEQAGRLLRITDSDGSIYSGFLQLTNNSSPLVAGRTAPSTASGALQSPKVISQKSVPASGTTQQFFFRVAGTNRSLSRPVVFTGNLVKITNSAAPQKTRVSGKAVVGGAQELSIDAVSLKP